MKYTNVKPDSFCFPETPYEVDFGTENDELREENGFYWDVSF
jgi:hypothetical protein